MRWVLSGATALLMAALLLLLVGLNMGRELNHDEHQFIAGATLIARDGLTPYRDFAFFHVPLQVYAYALLYSLFDALLLSSRLFSTFFGWLSVVLIFAFAWQHRPGEISWARWRFAALAALWMTALPLFSYTSGRAWNHDLPTFLMLLAVIIHGAACSQRRSKGWFVLSGLFIGLATATRLSFALIAFPFGLLIWLTPAKSIGKRLGETVLFGAGALIGLLPALLPFIRSPQAFLFGNLEYVRLNTRFFQQTDLSTVASDGGSALATTALSFGEKLAYFGALLVEEPTSLITLLALIVSLWPLRWLVQRSPIEQRDISGDGSTDELAALRTRLGFVLVLMLFALIGAFGATPSQPQYFYPLFPLALLGLIDAFSAWPAALRSGGIYAYTLGGLAAILVAIPIYAPGLTLLTRPGDWLPSKTAGYGQMIWDLAKGNNVAGSEVAAGKILTLAPLYALEGGNDIYPEFSTGPFAWRVAPLVPDVNRNRFHIVGPDDLPALLASDPPRAILTGVENDDADEEGTLIAYAMQNGFVPVTLPDESILWLSPLSAWGGTIQLGSASIPDRLLQPGESFLLTLYLQSLRSMAANYNVQVRVVGAEGEELLRDDGWPFGSRTSLWRVGDVWRDGHEFTVPQETKPGYYRVDVRFYDPESNDDLGASTTVGYLLIDGEGTEQTTTTTLAQFGDSIELQDATLTVNPAAEAKQVDVNLLWQTQKEIDGDYTLFVHVLDADEDLIAQADSPPLNGFLPTHAWSSQAPVRDTVRLALPPELPDGSYSVVIGLYDPFTLERLPVTIDGVGSGDSFVIGQLETGQ